MPAFPVIKLTDCKIPLFVLLFLCFGAAILGDSTAEALLLAHFGSGLIPRMFLVNAAFLAFFSLFMLSAIDRIDRGMFFVILCFCHAFVLLAVRFALFFSATFVFLPLFSYAYVSKILIFTLFWTLANDLIDSRRAGTQFPFIAAGGTLGAIGISFSIPWLLKFIAAPNLLLVWSGIVIVGALIFLVIRKSFGAQFKPPQDAYSRRKSRNILTDLRLLRDEPLLANMSIFYFILFFILINQHYTFYQQIKLQLADAKQLVSFLGLFNGISMGTTFLLQISVAGTIIRRIGATRAMFLMPSILTLVFGGLMVIGWTLPGGTTVLSGSLVIFWGVVTGMGARVAFFDSFFSPNFQLFFSSLPQSIRGRGKFALEGIIKPAAIVSASLWLMFAVPRLNFTINMAVLFAVSSLLVIQTFRIKKRYAGSLVRFLTGTRAGSDTFKRGMANIGTDSRMLEFFDHALDNEEPEIKYFIVKILSEIRSERAVTILLQHLESADNRLRATIISSLPGIAMEQVKMALLQQLSYDDTRVRANAVETLACFAHEASVQESLRPFITSPINRIRTNAIVALWPASGQEIRKDLLAVLNEMLNSSLNTDCSSALYGLGKLHMEEMSGTLEELGQSKSRWIVEDTSLYKQYLFACSAYASSRELSSLLHLAQLTRPHQRKAMITAISSMLKKQLQIVDLLQHLADADALSRSIMIHGLFEAEIHLEKAHEDILVRIATEETRAAFRSWADISVLDEYAESNPLYLLSAAIREESVNRHTNNVIYLVALLDRSNQIRPIIQRLHHENQHVRGRALEVIDNVGNNRISRMVIDLLDNLATKAQQQHAAAHYGFTIPVFSAVIEGYAEGNNTWLRECAHYARSQAKEAESIT
jgi:HEAT repeat protein